MNQRCDAKKVMSTGITLTTAAAGGVELRPWGTSPGQTGELLFDGLGSGGELC